MPSAAENPAGAPVASPSEQPSSAPMENMGMISPPLKPKPSTSTVSPAFTAKSAGAALPASAPRRRPMPVPWNACQPHASTIPANARPPTATSANGRAFARRRIARRSARRQAANSAPPTAQHRPTSRQCAATAHERPGSATRGIWSPMPTARAMA